MAQLHESRRIAIYASGVGLAGAALSVSLLASVNYTTYITGGVISCPAVAAVVSGLITITGIVTTLNYQFVETVSAGGWIPIELDVAIPASASNQAVTVNIPAIPGGGAVAVNIFGFQYLI